MMMVTIPICAARRAGHEGEIELRMQHTARRKAQLQQRPIAYIGQISLGTAYHMLSIDPALTGRIQPSIIDLVVVALREHVDLAALLLVHLDHAVHDRDLAVSHLEDDDVARTEGSEAHV